MKLYEFEKYRLRQIKATAAEIVELSDTDLDTEELDELIEEINLNYKKLKEEK